MLHLVTLSLCRESFRSCFNLPLLRQFAASYFPMTLDGLLRSKLGKYKNADLCRQDCARALHRYNNLLPDLRKFVHDDGREQELLALDGTLPVSIRGVTYNIPVCVWLQANHPHVPPLVYVKPTSSMAIRASQHVNTSGRVYLPFLHDWAYPKCDLLALLQILCCVFSDHPPVYLKPAQPQQPAAYRPPPAGYPPQYGAASTPYPIGGPARMPMSRLPMPGASPGGSSGSRPPYPPHPTQEGAIIGQVTKEVLEDKLRRSKRALIEQAQMELDQLNKTQLELKQRSDKLQDFLQKLEKEQENDNEDNDIKNKEEITEVVSQLESKTAGN